MPKAKSNLTIRLNLLKPQSNPEKILIKLFRWLLSSGRYIFIFVEALVLIAFAARFKLDADLATKKEAIDEQIPYIESLRSYEILIRNTQTKLATIDRAKNNTQDWSALLKRISDQMPSSIKITRLNITTNTGITGISITGQTQMNNDITSFVTDLKNDPGLSGINLSNLGLEQGVIKFTIEATIKKESFAEKKL